LSTLRQQRTEILTRRNFYRASACSASTGYNLLVKLCKIVFTIFAKQLTLHSKVSDW